MKMNKLILKLLKNVYKCRLKKEEISKFLTGEELNMLMEKGFLKEEVDFPNKCLVKGCNNPVECEIEEEKLIVTDIDIPVHRKTADINDYIVYEILIVSCFYELLDNLIEIPKEKKSEKQIMESCRIEINTEIHKLLFFGSISENIQKSDFFDLLNDSLPPISYKIIALKKSEENAKSLNSIYPKLSPTDLVYDLNLEDMVSKDAKRTLNSWIRAKHIGPGKLPDNMKNSLSTGGKGKGFLENIYVGIILKAIERIKSEILLYGVVVVAFFIISANLGIEILKELKWPVFAISTIVLITYFAKEVMNTKRRES